MNISARVFFVTQSLIGLFALFLFPTPLLAQSNGLLLVTSPLPISLSGLPGTSVSTDLRVKNGGTEGEKLKVSIMKFKAYEDSGKPALLEREEGDEFFDWVTFSEPTFTLAPNEWKTVTATITIPKEASFGYYYAFVFSRADDEVVMKEKETTIVGGTAVLVLLEVLVPDAKRKVEVVEFSLDRTFYEFLPAAFTVRLKNTGNVHIAPRGNIFIDQGNNRDIAILEINQEKGNILPDSNRDFETSWKDGFPLFVDKVENGARVLDKKGNGERELSFDWNNASKLRFGKYTANMLLIYDDGNRDIPIEGEVSFWVIPWRGMLGASLLCLFAFIGFRSTLQGMWRRISKRDPAV